MINTDTWGVIHWKDENGAHHREDGPAISCPSFSRWFLHGTEVSEELFNKVIHSPLKNIPLYIGMGFDAYIEKRLRGNNISSRSHSTKLDLEEKTKRGTF